MKLKSALSVMFLTLVIAACGGKDGGGDGGDKPGPGDDGMTDSQGDDGMQDGNNDGGNGDGGPTPGSLALNSFGAVADTGCPSSNLGASDEETCAIALAPPALSENFDAAAPGALAVNVVGAGLMDTVTVCDQGAEQYCIDNSDPSGRDAAWRLRCGVFNRRPVDFRCKIAEVDSRLAHVSKTVSSTLRRCMTRGTTLNNFDVLDESNPLSGIDFPHYLQCASQMNGPDDGLEDIWLSFGKEVDDWYIRTYGAFGAGNLTAKVDANDNMEIYDIGGGTAQSEEDADSQEFVHVITDAENETVMFRQFTSDGWACGVRGHLNSTHAWIEGLTGSQMDCENATVENVCIDISVPNFTVVADGNCADIDEFPAGFDRPFYDDYTVANIDAFRAVDPDGVYNTFIPDPLYQARNVFFAETGYPNIKKILDSHLGKDGIGGEFARSEVWACVEATEEKAFDLGAEPFFDVLAGEEVPLKFDQMLSCASNEAFFGFKEDNFYGRVFKDTTATTLRSAKDGSSYELWEMASDSENESQVVFGVAGEGERLEVTITGENMDVACGGQLATDGEYLYLNGRFMAGTPDADTTSGGPCSDDFAEELCAQVGDAFEEQDSMTECDERGLSELILPALRPDGDNALDFSELTGIYTKKFDLADVKDFAGSGEGSGGEGEGDDGEGDDGEGGDGETTGEEGEGVPAE